MTSNIMEYLTLFPKELRAFVMSALPIIELRGSIPISISMGISVYKSLWICFLGSLMPLPFLLYGIRPIFKILSKVPALEKIINKLSIRSVRKSEIINKYGLLGLVLFVGIPLPGTGIWSGALIATLLDIRLKRSIVAISLGNLISGIIVTLLTTGVIHIFSYN